MMSLIPGPPLVSALSIAALARRAGLSWATTRNVLRGEGTIASLDSVRRAVDMVWSWGSGVGGALPGRDLARLREGKGLSQHAMAQRLAVSPQTILTLETEFRGRCATLAA